MRTKIIFFLICILSFSNNSPAQTENGKCGFQISKEEYVELKNPKTNLNLIFNKLKTLKKAARKRILQLIVINKIVEIKFAPKLNPPPPKEEIPIVAHILRRDDGTGGLSVAVLYDAINVVNKKFADTNLSFKLCEIKEINSTLLYSLPYSSDVEFDDDPNTLKAYNILEVEKRNTPNKLNIYFYPWGNASWVYSISQNSSTQHIMMLNEMVSNKATLSHEIGHWFSLIHTHGPSNEKRTKELVNGMNCEDTGDLLCDTPADHNLYGRVKSSTCNYTPTLAHRDANNMMYDPDEKNLMSYALAHCKSYFSPLQEVKIQAAFYSMIDDRGYTFDPCN